MKNEQSEQTQNRKQWRSASELPQEVFTVLHKPNKAINPVAIVATVDPDGKPRTAPFGSLRAVTPKLLRLACFNYHDTYINLYSGRQTSVAVLAPPNIAVSLRGRARVVKAQMDISQHFVVIEIDVEEVKNDMTDQGIIESGIGFMPPEDNRNFYIGAIAELEDM